MLHGLGICPGVVYGNVGGVFLKGVVDVDYLGVADVRAVFLECDAEKEDAGVFHLDTFEVHGFDGLVGHVGAHAVVEASGGEHHAGQHAVYLCFLYQVVGVD